MRLREIWQAGSEKLTGYQTDQEIYGAMHTQVLELLSCDPAATCEAQLRETKARLAAAAIRKGDAT